MRPFSVLKIECILSALPEPSENDIKAVGSGFGSVLLNQSKSINSNPSMDELLTDSPSEAKHLIKSLLVLVPSKRLTAKQALCHKYVEKYLEFSSFSKRKLINNNSIFEFLIDSVIRHPN